MFRVSSSARYYWTQHSRVKMAFYRLSESRVRRVLKSPMRVEEGIAPDTVAFMQPVSYKIRNGVKTWNQELWVMVAANQNKNEKIKGKNDDLKFKSKIKNQGLRIKGQGLRIISAWRYPGKTKPEAPLPDAILQEVEEAMAVI